MTTELTESVPAGATSIAVGSVAGFIVGCTIVISGGANEEKNVIVGFGSISLGSPLQYAYPVGSTILQLQESGIATSVDEESLEASSLILIIVGGCAVVLLGIAVCVFWRCRRQSQHGRRMLQAEIPLTATPTGCDKKDPRLKASGEKRRFWFITRKSFLELPEDGSCPRHQELRDRNKLVLREVSMADVMNGTLAKDTASVSHRWPVFWHWDPDGAKVKKLKAVLRKHPHIMFIWIDFLCAPQKPLIAPETLGDRTAEEQEEFSTILHGILPYIFLSTRVWSLFDRDYNRRFWPCVETWIATKTPTANGLEASTLSNLRLSVFGVLSCEGQDESSQRSCIDSWHKVTTTTAIAILTRDDIHVTNKKNKDVSLGPLHKVDAHIKELFEDMRAAGEVDSDDLKFEQDLKTLELRMDEAAANRNYILAGQLRDQIKNITDEEISRLTAKMTRIASLCDFEQADRLKRRIEFLKPGDHSTATARQTAPHIIQL